MISETGAIIFVYSSCAIGILWGLFNASAVMGIEVRPGAGGDESLKDKNIAGLIDIGTKVSNGANAFLKQEYTVMTMFFLVFSIVVFILVDIYSQQGNKVFRIYATLSYIIGAVTSILCGLIGMKIAVNANFRTTYKAITSLADAFSTAFQAGCVMGFCMVSISLGMLITLFLIYKSIYSPGNYPDNSQPTDGTHTFPLMFDLLAGYGLGGSSMALFGRVGGGIYTKAADVGADLVGKVEENLAEDSPRNPATIADNVGDNVGDIAGMGADLFGSFAESTCAALVLIGGSYEMVNGGPAGTSQTITAVYYPMIISAVGIFCSLLSSAIGIYGYRVTEIPKIEKALNLQLLISTFFILIALYFASMWSLPDQWNMTVRGKTRQIKWWYCYVSTSFGLVSGFLIGLSTDYYTSNAHYPVQEMAGICPSGAAINVIYGLALGYLSNIVPIILLSVTIIVGTFLLGMLGVALAAIGMLSNLCICLAIDAYGPISDNAGGIAEMCEIGEEVRAKTDALDAAGNTTAAVGKGFAIGSACLVALALFGAFLTRVNVKLLIFYLYLFSHFLFRN